MDFVVKTSQILQMDAVFLIQFSNSLVLKFARLNVQIRVSMETISILSVLYSCNKNSMGFTLWVTHDSRQDWLLVRTNKEYRGYTTMELLQNLKNYIWGSAHDPNPHSFCVDFECWYEFLPTVHKYRSGLFWSVKVSKLPKGMSTKWDLFCISLWLIGSVYLCGSAQ